MNQEEKKKYCSTLPVLSRLDRLEYLVQFMEEKHSLSSRQGCLGPEEDDDYGRKMEDDRFNNKTLSLALEEVHRKGSLMDRLAMLENRVLQLNLVIDGAGNTSRSSSTSPASYSLLDEGTTQACVEGEEVLCSIKKQPDCKKSRKKRSVSALQYRKWFGWFPIRCQ